MSQELEKREEGGVPDLAYNPAMQVDADDINKPRLKIGHWSHDAVRDGNVEAGQLFLEEGREFSRALDYPLTVYVTGWRKGWSWQDDADELQRARFDEAHPDDADKTYDFYLAIPGVEDQVPVTYLLKRSTAPIARNIISYLTKQAAVTPAHELGFEITGADQKTKDKYKYFVPVIRPVAAAKTAAEKKAREADQEVVSRVLPMTESMLAQAAQAPAPALAAPADGDVPAI